MSFLRTYFLSPQPTKKEENENVPKKAEKAGGTV